MDIFGNLWRVFLNINNSYERVIYINNKFLWMRIDVFFDWTVFVLKALVYYEFMQLL